MYDSIRAVMREPLSHFLLGGAALFLLFGLVSKTERTADDELVVTVGQIEHMVSMFEKTRQRNPTTAELDGLIESFIVEEVMYREAIAIGIDTDDTIIRRRLRQKMEFLLDDFTVVEPSDADLQKYLDDHPDRFRTDALIWFNQIYLNEFSLDKAENLLVALRSGEVATPAELSESFLLPYRFDEASEAAVRAQFGEKFQASLFELDALQWIGPVESPFGIHLVRIEKIVTSRVPTLPEIRKDVTREWLVDFRSTAQDEIVDQMRQKYTITIESPEAPQE